MYTMVEKIFMKLTEEALEKLYKTDKSRGLTPKTRAV